MDIRELFADAASRPVEAARALPTCSPEQLNAHPLGHDNSIAWLLWHTGREIDVQTAALSGTEEVWNAQGFRDRLDLAAAGDDIGYGHSAAEARSIHTADQAGLVDYLAAATASLIEYASSLSDEDFDEIIDTSWDPPVTRGTRLVSIVDDAAQHVGQAAYLAGMPHLGAGVS
ncbi:DinB superfamily protein [Bowdeniella nasicola]|uniref:DinB superfamily protein n=1 Tax=Bowdeniella nasicola TaxID=208480 RepID=A0A1H3YRM1_9ACTO|nr:DinB family protein [Bowdeniella nasicola]SEA14057.1 DinB superfamily protein [Bowdeniella nasicola]